MCPWHGRSGCEGTRWREREVCCEKCPHTSRLMQQPFTGGTPVPRAADTLRVTSVRVMYGVWFLTGCKSGRSPSINASRCSMGDRRAVQQQSPAKPGVAPLTRRIEGDQASTPMGNAVTDLPQPEPHTFAFFISHYSIIIRFLAAIRAVGQNDY